MLKIAAHTTRLSFKVILVLFVVFILPALAHLGVKRSPIKLAQRSMVERGDPTA